MVWDSLDKYFMRLGALKADSLMDVSTNLFVNYNPPFGNGFYFEGAEG
jgi:hypothetical protein